MVVLDTSILIDFLRRPKSDDSQLIQFNRLHPTEKIAISILTIQELYSGQSSKDGNKEQLFLKVVNKCEILPYTYEIARLAGELVRDIKSSLGFPDAAIAATTILNKAKLLTLNKKDFHRINGLKLI